MKRYLRIYFLLIKLNIHKAIANRGDFFSGFFGSIAWGLFSIVAVYILSARTNAVYGWNRNELYILMGVFNIVVGGIFRMVCALNFDKMSGVIQHGELDTYLLKPVSSQFMLSFLDIQIYNLFRISSAIIFTFYMLNQANVPIALTSVFTFIILTIFGFITIYSFWFLVMTLLLWFPDLYNLSEILYTTDNLTRYPPQILLEMRVLLFYVFIPYTLVVSTPTKALLYKLTSFDAALLIGVACGLLYISTKFWKFALRYYTSASG